MIQIQNSTYSDIPEIFRFYKAAKEYMKSKSVVVWPEFGRAMVEQEIAEGNQWKMIIDGKMACIWATAYADPKIWEERNIDPAVYIHRIAVNPTVRGRKLVRKIVDWAVDHAKEKNLDYVRLDTVGENFSLIKLYTEAGFDFLGMHKLKNPEGLPEHYHKDRAALFELKVFTN